MTRIRTGVFSGLVASLLLHCSVLSAQPQERLWQKLATFPHQLNVICFLDLGGPPKIGFAGCDSAIYRTTDGGQTWQEMIVNDLDFRASEICFKNKDTGWFSNWFDRSTSHAFYVTTDGGITWQGK